MRKELFPLALGGLGIGTTEFVIMGLLQDVSHALQISIPSAGMLISAYALGVVIGAPVLVALSSKHHPKKILMALMVMFTIFNGLSALAPEYYTLLFARFFSGLPHGAFFGVGAVVARRLARPGKEAQSISMMLLGLTVANLVMVPIVTYLGHNTNWRLAFGVVAAIGVVTLFFLRAWLPPLDRVNNVPLSEELKFIRSAPAGILLLITCIGFAGFFAWMSFISPLLTNVSGFQEKQVSYIMMLAGAGMVVGNILGGIIADRYDPIKASGIVFVLLIMVLLAIFFFSGNATVSLVLTFLCGALSMAVGTPINFLMMKTAKSSEMMAAAFMQAGFNVANSLGAFAGGWPLKMGLGFNYPALVGSIMAFMGLLLCYYYYVRFGKKQLAVS